MSELPKYIKSRIGFSVSELEMLIASMCKETNSIRMVDRFIQTRLTEYEILYRNKTINDFEKCDYRDWKDIEEYFGLHRFSFERQYFKRRLWE